MSNKNKAPDKYANCRMDEKYLYEYLEWMCDNISISFEQMRYDIDEFRFGTSMMALRRLNDLIGLAKDHYIPVNPKKRKRDGIRHL